MTNKSKFFAELKKHENAEKFDLTNHKIMLSSVNVIREALDMTYFEEEVYDRIDEAQSKMVEARDIFKFDMASNLLNAEDEINYLKSKLDELGVEYPSEIADFENEISERENTFEEVRRRFRDMGYDPIS